MSAKVITSTPTTRNRRSANQAWRRLLIALVAGVMASQSIGCVPPGQLETDKMFDKSVGVYRDKVWAKRAYNLRYANCERQYGDHFRDGFVEGYCSVCKGNKGYVPAMPPEDYWKSQYQTAEGAKCVNAWFEGFPIGAEAAKKDGAGKFHDIYISNMVNSAVVQEKQSESLKLPSQVPVVAPSASQPQMPQAMTQPHQVNQSATFGQATPFNQSAPAMIDTTVGTGVPVPMNGMQPASYEIMLGNQ